MELTNEQKLNKYRQPDKNDDIVFGTKWFEKYQSRLLWLLNTPIIKVWFRWIMRIRKYDCDTIINQITPNSFSYSAKRISKKKIQITTDFRTHDKYSKRLYFAFKSLWYLLHAFDWALLDRIEYATKLSFGFSTLTQYPGSIGTNNPVDGHVAQAVDNATWAATRDGAGNSFGYASGNAVIKITNGNTSGFVNLFRSIFCFDTSSLTSGATISASVLSLFGTAKSDGLSISLDADIYVATPANTNALVNGDFTQIGTTSQTGSPITYANLSATAYNDFTFNATGQGNVSKTGISKFGCRNANKDVANSAPAYVGSYIKSEFVAKFSDTAGTTDDPKLVVTYTLPATGNMFLMF